MERNRLILGAAFVAATGAIALDHVTSAPHPPPALLPIAQPLPAGASANPCAAAPCGAAPCAAYAPCAAANPCAAAPPANPCGAY